MSPSRGSAAGGAARGRTSTSKMGPRASAKNRRINLTRAKPPPASDALVAGARRPSPRTCDLDPRRGSGARERLAHADVFELGLHDLFVERLHQDVVGAGVHRARDVSDIVFARAE